MSQAQSAREGMGVRPGSHPVILLALGTGEAWGEGQVGSILSVQTDQRRRREP